MKISPYLATTLFSSSNTSALLSIATGGGGTTSTQTQRDPIATLKDAEKNSAKYIAAKAAEPQVKRDLDAFENAVKNAKTVDEFFKNDAAVKVFLTANGLGDQAQFKVLAERALRSDSSDENSLATKLGASRPAWLETAKAYDFFNKGLSVLNARKDVVTKIRKAYTEVLWRQSLDAAAPGVSAALSFKANAASFTNAYQILGDPVGREVVTTAFGLPKQIAYQTVVSQADLIDRRLDISKLQSPAFVDALVKRYLITLNGSASTSA